MSDVALNYYTVAQMEKHLGMANTVQADFIIPSVYIKGTKSISLMAEEYHKTNAL